jgi:hypothetical protein
VREKYMGALLIPAFIFALLSVGCIVVALLVDDVYRTLSIVFAVGGFFLFFILFFVVLCAPCYPRGAIQSSMTKQRHIQIGNVFSTKKKKAESLNFFFYLFILGYLDPLTKLQTVISVALANR